MFTQKSKLKKQKKYHLFVAMNDLAYIMRFKYEAYMFEEKPARREMGTLNKKKKELIITEEEDKRLSELVDQITESTAVKNEVEKTSKVIEELKDYISFL